MEDIGRIRAKAFCGANLAPEATRVIIDEVDFDPQAYVFGVFYDEELISTIRIHHVTPDHRVSSSGKVFSEAMNQYLDAGMSLVDPARLASDADAFRELPGMHLLTMRLAVVATEFFGADRLVTTVRSAAQRVLPAHDRVAHRGARDDVRGRLHRPVSLMASDFKDSKERIYRRFPFFRAQPYEMRMLFGDLAAYPSAPLTILPTARYASNAGDGRSPAPCSRLPRGSLLCRPWRAEPDLLPGDGHRGRNFGLVHVSRSRGDCLARRVCVFP